MTALWKKAFSKVEDSPWQDSAGSIPHVDDLDRLEAILDRAHISRCLLKPFEENADYPLVEARELLPSFEADLVEHKQLPGFSLVALERPLNHFQEIFQYDILHPLLDWQDPETPSEACPLEENTLECNLATVESRLPKNLHKDLRASFSETDLCGLENYADLLPFLLEMERGQVLALDRQGHFALHGIHASFPSDLDSELKRFGLRINKFSPGDSVRYEKNRLFVYQFLMELHGFPIVSERRTSAALFARRLHRLGERFLVRVLGQSDRTLTTLSSGDAPGHYPRVEKIALVQVPANQSELLELLEDQDFLVDKERRVVILRVRYKQHRYDPRNVHEDRALSVLDQEVVHPLTGRTMSGVNLIYDTGSMLLQLNDIVRGEYPGTITYKRSELVQGTESHAKRLKFLSSWLSKHQRRLINYSEEFYAKIIKVLNSYLDSPEQDEALARHPKLHREVADRLGYITQARQVRGLEELARPGDGAAAKPWKERLEAMASIMEHLKFELVKYHEGLARTALDLCLLVLDDAYLARTYMTPPAASLSEYGRTVRKAYGRLVAAVDEVRSICNVRQGMACAEPSNPPSRGA